MVTRSGKLKLTNRSRQPSDHSPASESVLLRPAPDSAPEYQARAILKERNVRGHLQYLIDWEKDVRTGEDFKPSWEPEENVNEALVEEWLHRPAHSCSESKEHEPVEVRSTRQSVLNRQGDARDLVAEGRGSVSASSSSSSTIKVVTMPATRSSTRLSSAFKQASAEPAETSRGKGRAKAQTKKDPQPAAQTAGKNGKSATPQAAAASSGSSKASKAAEPALDATSVLSQATAGSQAGAPPDATTSLERMEFALPLPLSKHSLDDYKKTSEGLSVGDLLKKFEATFVDDEPPEATEDFAKIEAAIDSLRKASIHRDLVAADEEEGGIASHQAEWAKHSSKFHFLDALMKELSDVEIHVIILCTSVEVMRLVETQLIGCKVNYQRLDTNSKADPAKVDGLLQATIMPHDWSGSGANVPKADLILTLDHLFDASNESIHALRLAPKSNRLCPAISIVAPNTIEHIEFNLAPTFSPRKRQYVILKCSLRLMSEVSKSVAKPDEMEATTKAVANFVKSHGTEVDWPKGYRLGHIAHSEASDLARGFVSIGSTPTSESARTRRSAKRRATKAQPDPARKKQKMDNESGTSSVTDPTPPAAEATSAQDDLVSVKLNPNLASLPSTKEATPIYSTPGDQNVPDSSRFLPADLSEFVYKPKTERTELEWMRNQLVEWEKSVELAMQLVDAEKDRSRDLLRARAADQKKYDDMTRELKSTVKANGRVIDRLTAQNTKLNEKVVTLTARFNTTESDARGQLHTMSIEKESLQTKVTKLERELKAAQDHAGFVQDVLGKAQNSAIETRDENNKLQEENKRLSLLVLNLGEEHSVQSMRQFKETCDRKVKIAEEAKKDLEMTLAQRHEELRMLKRGHGVSTRAGSAPKSPHVGPASRVGSPIPGRRIDALKDTANHNRRSGKGAAQTTPSSLKEPKTAADNARPAQANPQPNMLTKQPGNSRQSKSSAATVPEAGRVQPTPDVKMSTEGPPQKKPRNETSARVMTRRSAELAQQQTPVQEPEKMEGVEYTVPQPAPESNLNAKAANQTQIHPLLRATQPLTQAPAHQQKPKPRLPELRQDPKPTEKALEPKMPAPKPTPKANAQALTPQTIAKSTDANRVTTTPTTTGTSARPFPCCFLPYGCPAAFTSKNEWKRHISTKHIQLNFWRCDMCGSSPGIDVPVFNDFNRKDLFTQHLRRMHPSTVPVIKDENTTQPSTTTASIPDDQIALIQERCHRRLRYAPESSNCVFCPREFSGANSWEERLEHVGGHLERDRKNGSNCIDVSQWRDDPALRDYLLLEGIIEVDQRGGYRIGDGKPRRPVDIEGFQGQPSVATGGDQVKPDSTPAAPTTEPASEESNGKRRRGRPPKRYTEAETESPLRHVMSATPTPQAMGYNLNGGPPVDPQALAMQQQQHMQGSHVPPQFMAVPPMPPPNPGESLYDARTQHYTRQAPTSAMQFIIAPRPVAPSPHSAGLQRPVEYSDVGNQQPVGAGSHPPLAPKPPTEGSHGARAPIAPPQPAMAQFRFERPLQAQQGSPEQTTNANPDPAHREDKDPGFHHHPHMQKVQQLEAKLGNRSKPFPGTPGSAPSPQSMANAQAHAANNLFSVFAAPPPEFATPAPPSPFLSSASAAPVASPSGEAVGGAEDKSRGRPGKGFHDVVMS
ncbi:hypothetical protein EJ06DRAFT_314812 [Trichodelitschia bisporula]|uniref:Chromo domain-containing protein n=1 Tax=Trichodelitschia bisporula TaxID=703511 RepID=A0A6G1I476_9PEZI|nr:hypothetical protein EJ06DRAFT_314812 [Trichodelitschia bisporula]